VSAARQARASLGGNLVTLLLVAVLPVIVAVLLLLRYGSIFERGGRWSSACLPRITVATAAVQVGELDDAVRLLYRSPVRLLAATGWQLSGLIAGTLETWLALPLACSSITLANALALESVVQAVRSFMFVVPASMGVQEAGLIALGALLGRQRPGGLWALSSPSGCARSCSACRCCSAGNGMKAGVSAHWPRRRPRWRLPHSGS